MSAHTLARRISRPSRGLLVAATAGVLSAPVQASDFYKLTIIAETSSQAGSNWRLDGQAAGINNLGFATWRSDRLVNGAFEFGIFVGNGLPPSTPSAPGTPFVVGASVSGNAINSAGQGQVSYLDGLTLRLWDRATGTTTEIGSCASTSPTIRCPTIPYTLSDNARFTTLINNNPQVWEIVDSSGRQVLGVALPTTYANSNQTHVISRGGSNAASFGRTNGGAAAAIGALDPRIPGQFGSATLGSASEWAIRGVSTNDLGNIAFLSEKGASTTIRPFVGVVNPRLGTNLMYRVADDSGGAFTDFGTGGRGPAINNLNQVGFPATKRGSVGHFPFVGDVTGRAPTPVADPDEPIPDSNGAVFGTIQQNGISPHALNDKGQFVFQASIRRGTASVPAVIRADPVVGVSPGNPILPDLGRPLPAGWRFPLTCVVPTFCRVISVPPSPSGTARAPRTPVRFIDPPLAVGYAYEVEAPGPNFASVSIPAPLPNGDDTFQVEFNGQVAALKAGEEFDFTAVVPGGVSTFRITGIDTAETLDPTNATAFVTGLTFVTDSITDYSVTMVPIVQDPNDADLDGVPNAADLCPNTAPGAAVDANGCAANQRDSDSDGIVDSLDQCPATPIGTAVNANGCSAQQLDNDLDGVPNTSDLCPNTAPGVAVDSSGCSAAQRDSDGDGVADSLDQCPATPAGTPVNANGCSVQQLDSDLDGVPNTVDQCPNTASGAAVDANGCAAEQRDSDGDGVVDSLDQCPATPQGASVNAVGCAASQLDSDGDGVADSADLCTGTPRGTAVDANGCPVPQPTSRCDVNGDKFIDYRDIQAIILAIGKSASGPTDPRDANGNGRIDLIDAAICTTKCTRLLCLPPK